MMALECGILWEIWKQLAQTNMRTLTLEADLECMELNCDREDCAEEPVLYGVGKGNGDTCVGIGDNTCCSSGGVMLRVVASAFH